MSALRRRAGRRARSTVDRASGQMPLLSLDPNVMWRRRMTTARYGVMAGAASMMLMQHLTSTSVAPSNSAADVGAVVAESGVDGGSVPLYPAYPDMGSLPAPPSVPDLSGVVGGKAQQQELPAVQGIPATVLQAYRRATDNVRAAKPECHLPLPLLAAIGRVESGHARGGNVDVQGTTRSPILGPRLDGGAGVAAIRDTDGGVYDGDTRWDRAVGPMQFIPATWRRWAADGNADGVSNPHNVFDATLAAGRYLCAAGRDVATPDGLQRAILAYNHSESYLNLVLAWMRLYDGGSMAVPDTLGPTGAAPEGNARQAGYQAAPPRENARGPARAQPTPPAAEKPTPAPPPGPAAPVDIDPGGGALPESPSTPSLPAGSLPATPTDVPLNGH